MKTKQYAKISALALAIFSASPVHAKVADVCINVENISNFTASIEAYDTIDEVQWVGLTGGPLRIGAKSKGHGCFKTAYKDSGVSIVVTAKYMGDIKTKGGVAIKDVSVEGSYSGKAIQTTSDGYSGYIGTFKDQDTLVIK